MEFLSVISKGTTRDKLLWAFTFYDVRSSITWKPELIMISSIKRLSLNFRLTMTVSSAKTKC